MAGVGWFVATRLSPAALAIVGAGLAMAACFGLLALVLNIAGVGRMAMRAAEGRAVSKLFLPMRPALGREEAGSG